IAPLFAGEATRTVVMPEGSWHDFWTGEPIAGGAELSVPASAERIPVYVKSRSIVPWADVGLFAEAPKTRRIVARVYGDGSSPFVLNNGKDTLRLRWSNGRGSVDGENTGYDVYSWKQLG
ncbi:MAG: hypothetical protein WBE38_00685, partial [Terracidiphilus sp.]